MNLGTATQNTGFSSSEKELNASLAFQLERAKEELELISYVSSHDLQAPLRAILASCETLEKNAAIASDKEAKADLQKITRQTGKMRTLMQGLLDYLRLETFGPTRSMLDMNEIVAAAMTILEENIRATGAKIVYGSLPQFYGHRGRMTRLFVSLLDNALKFRSQQQPEITISASANGRELEFQVEDNGIGIDEEYHDIIFTLFQRLHTEEEYPGYGIGLALSRKIVESHGGRMWMESVPGKGSRFRFTLPAAKM